MFRRLSFYFAFAGATLIPLLSFASFQIESQSVHVDSIHRQISFELTFNQPPDFTTLDAVGRPKNSFQYWIDTQPDAFDFSGPGVAVIRGPEIRFNHNIPIRDTINPTNQDIPHAEGWGPERGAVDFQLQGKTLEFTVPWKLLNETNGKFSFDVISLEFGSEISDIAGAVIGLPPPLEMCAGLLVIAWFLRNRAHLT